MRSVAQTLKEHQLPRHTMSVRTRTLIVATTTHHRTKTFALSMVGPSLARLSRNKVRTTALPDFSADVSKSQ